MKNFFLFYILHYKCIFLGGVNIEKYYLWLSTLYKINNKKQILDRFSNIESFYHASQNELKEKGLTENMIKEIIKSKDKDMDNIYDKMEKDNIRFISIENNEFPEDLKNIYNPPIGLYIKGEISSNLKISMVGTRNASNYGKGVAERLAGELSKRGVTVVSGMALGIDTHAHKGAIDKNGGTIAVLGNGLDICYPKSNRDLFKKIPEKGAIISEYFLGTEPMPWHFPMRNRIISGISAGTLVVEAPNKSGSIITANLALEQGKEVLGVPGNINSKRSEGTNTLIREGAHLVSKVEDIFDAFGIIEPTKKEENKKPKLAPKEKLIYDSISFAPITVDEIFYKTDLKIQEIQYILTKLEFEKLVNRLPGQKFVRK